MEGRIVKELNHHQRFVSTWPQIWSKSVEISVDSSNVNAPLCASSQIFILLFPAIVVVIATIFSDIFDGFNNVFNVLNNEFEWKKSGLSNNEYDVCGVLSSTNNTMDTLVFNYGPTGVGLRVFNINRYVFNAVLSAPTVTNNNENEMIFGGGPSGDNIQTTHSTAPSIERVSYKLVCFFYDF